MEGLAALRLLIIDDNEQMRTIIGAVLGAVGIRQLYYAPDGRRGLEVVASTAIDAVYVDHAMPAMNGLEFISKVRALKSQDRYLPIIMLTGYSDRKHLEEARDRGVTEFLCKPVTAKSILSRLDAVILRPRPFVFSDGYFGPDRRRSRLTAHGCPRRRSTDAAEAVEL